LEQTIAKDPAVGGRVRRVLGSCRSRRRSTVGCVALCVEVEGSHLIIISQPEAVTDLILKAVHAVS